MSSRPPPRSNLAFLLESTITNSLPSNNGKQSFRATTHMSLRKTQGPRELQMQRFRGVVARTGGNEGRGLESERRRVEAAQRLMGLL